VYYLFCQHDMGNCFHIISGVYMNAVFIAFGKYFSKYFGPKESSTADLLKSSGSHKTGGSAKFGYILYMINVFVHVFAYFYTYIYMYIYIYVYTYFHMYIFMYILKYRKSLSGIRNSFLLHIWIYVYICAYIYICIHMHIYK
jgi:hypothetical protein